MVDESLDCRKEIEKELDEYVNTAKIKTIFNFWLHMLNYYNFLNIREDSSESEIKYFHYVVDDAQSCEEQNRGVCG